jgi:endoglycosylceramidase
VILNGINHVTKVRENRYLNDGDELLFRQFRDWGFNCIRYGIFWNALEPEPGKIDEDYLKEIDKRVEWAKENNLWLILDMHQDLFSTKFGDGGPLWATIDEGLPHVTGSLWSDAYTISPALQKSFDNFWANAPAPDGKGIQDHYINVWKILAERYAAQTSVIGFDVMNEPFMGTLSGTVMYKFLESYAQLVALQTGKVLTEKELTSMWYDETKKMEILNSLNDKEKYAYIVRSAEEAVREFEEKTLSGFYQRLRDAIREADTHHILFLEHNVFCNLGIKSGFLIPSDAQGNKDTLCAYAPHGYDLVTDTKFSLSQSFNRAKQFVCEWEETNTEAPTRIYAPDFAQLTDKKRIRLVPQSDIQFIPLGKSGKGYIEIQPLGGKRSIAISLN